MKLGDLLPAGLMVGIGAITITILANIAQSMYDAHPAPNSTAAGWVQYSVANVSKNGLYSLKEIGLWLENNLNVFSQKCLRSPSWSQQV